MVSLRTEYHPSAIYLCCLLSVICELTGDEDTDDGEEGEQDEEDGEAGGGEADPVHDLLGHDAALRS